MTIAGVPGREGNENGIAFADGPGSAAHSYSPRGLAVDSAGGIYVADTGNAAVRKLAWGAAVTKTGMCNDSQETASIGSWQLTGGLHIGAGVS